MKSPVDCVRGRIVDYDPIRQEIIIRAKYTDWPMMIKRDYQECLVQLLDGRPITDKQRRTCYALIRDISKATGQGINSVKENLKKDFLSEEPGIVDEETFSLSDASVSRVCAFQRYLVRFIIDYDIPCSIPLLEFADDVGDYLYACLTAKKCCVCGKKADLHHVEHVGAGRDREEIIHEGMEVQPLCRKHHNEAHNMGQDSFNQKYHIGTSIRLDKALCRVYGLKTKESEEMQIAE